MWHKVSKHCPFESGFMRLSGSSALAVSEFPWACGERLLSISFRIKYADNRFVGHSSWCCCRSARQSLKWERVLKGIKSVHCLCFFVLYFLWFLLLPFPVNSAVAPFRPTHQPISTQTGKRTHRSFASRTVRLRYSPPKRKSARTS